MTTTMQALAGVPIAAQALLDTPVGRMTALATERGLAALLFPSDKYHQGPFQPPPGHALAAHSPHLDAAQRWLDAYWQGHPPPTSDLAFDLHGSAFQRAVWRALLTIPFGHTHTYGELAARVCSGASARATGAAVGRNPVAVIVPCHRVIGANGSLTGYASGLPLKQQLLAHEGVLLV